MRMGIREEFESIGVVKKPRNIQKWQDTAARMAKELGIKGGNDWFGFFKRAYKKDLDWALHRAFTYTIDARHPDKKKLFFWAFWAAIDKKI